MLSKNCFYPILAKVYSYVLMFYYFNILKRGGWVGTTLLHIKCWVGHSKGCVKFKFIDISLYKENNSEPRQNKNIFKFIVYCFTYYYIIPNIIFINYNNF